MKLSFKSFSRYFQGSNSRFQKHFKLSSQYLITQTLIRACYTFLFFLAIINLESWNIYLNKTDINPLWVVYWLEWFDLSWGITLILWFNIIGGFLAITLPKYRIVRILIFLSLLEFHGLKNSFGKIGHGSHLAIFISFLLIFLPQGWHLVKQNKKLVKASVLTIFSACQVMIMLTYTMSSLGKILHIIVQAMRGEVHALMPKGLSLLVADRLLQTETNSYLGGWIIDHYYVGWILMLGTIYLQFFALWVAFRPSLHQLWGLGLIMFHISVYLTMTITFEQNCLWLAIFFLYSPFRPNTFQVQNIINDLPLFNLLVSHQLKNKL